MDKITAKTAGVASNKSNKDKTGRRSFDNPSLSVEGFELSKFGDRAADIRDCERNSNPHIATSAAALVQESTSVK
jgi:hypothetical protein